MLPVSPADVEKDPQTAALIRAAAVFHLNALMVMHDANTGSEQAFDSPLFEICRIQPGFPCLCILQAAEKSENDAAESDYLVFRQIKSRF